MGFALGHGLVNHDRHGIETALNNVGAVCGLRRQVFPAGNENWIVDMFRDVLVQIADSSWNIIGPVDASRTKNNKSRGLSDLRSGLCKHALQHAPMVNILPIVVVGCVYLTLYLCEQGSTSAASSPS